MMAMMLMLTTMMTITIPGTEHENENYDNNENENHDASDDTGIAGMIMKKETITKMTTIKLKTTWIMHDECDSKITTYSTV